MKPEANKQQAPTPVGSGALLGDGSIETITADLKDCTKGEATIHPAMPMPIFAGRKCVVVGIIGSKKVIAICGDTGAADEKESIANAIRIATDWNERNTKSPNEKS